MSIYDKASLVLIPSGTKTSKVYSQKPTNGDGDFTFSRSTAATRVNASGNIEKETQNLFTYSNTFSNSAWNKNAGGSFTSGQAGYDGSNDAWQFNVTTASNSGTWQNVTFSGVATFSAYFKKGTIDKVGFTNYAGNAYECWFDLTNGTIGQQTGDLIDANIESVGGGWYRCSITDIAVSTNYFQLKPSNAYSGVSTAGYIYIQDAQLEQGLVARDYIETTTTAIYGGITDNVPRLDYQGSCPALLLEPQRTNLVDYSEYYDLFDNNVTLTTNADTSPEGVDNASKIVVSSESQPRIERYNTWSNSTTYSMSAYVKADTGRYIGFGLYSPEMGNQWVRFDLTNETFGYSDTNWSNAAIVDAGDDWYRISATITTDATNTSRSGFKLASMKSNSYNTGTIGDSFFVYGIQVEAGSYATSYIPTYGSAVTRNADAGQVFNLDTNGILGSSQWTFFAELEVHNNTPSSDKMALTDADSMPRTYLYNTTLGWAGGWSGSSYNLNLNTNSKVAWRLNDSRNGNIFANGALRATISNQSVDMTADRIFLRGAQGKWRLRQIILFPTALTDQELIDLTTL